MSDHLVKVTQWIEQGKQLGKVFSFTRDEKIFWSSIGIQKFEGRFKVYVDEIEEAKMASYEEYLIEATRSFETLNEALDYLFETTHVVLEDLAPCKGQKVFNPNFE